MYTLLLIDQQTSADIVKIASITKNYFFELPTELSFSFSTHLMHS